MKLLPVILLVSFGAMAQQPPPPPVGGAPQPGGAKQRPEPKNLKILQPQEVMPSMRAFRTALGVECTFCHVEGNFASDDKPNKEMARKMLVMTREVNGKFPDGKMHVSCYTCHRGATEPAMAPPAAEKPGQ